MARNIEFLLHSKWWIDVALYRFPSYSFSTLQHCQHLTQQQFSRSSTNLGMLSHVQLLATPWTVAHQAALFLGFPRQEYWRGLLRFPLGDLSNLGSNLRRLHWQAHSLLLSHQGSPLPSLKSPLFIITPECHLGCKHL